MEKERLQYLLEQHLADKASAEEQQELSALLKADTHPGLFKALMADKMQQETPALPANLPSWQKMAEDIAAIDKPALKVATIGRTRIFHLYRWAAAAAVLLVALTVTFYFTNGPDSPTAENIIPANAVKPGNYNRLIFPDGSQLLLDEQKNGVIANLGNITIAKQDKQIIYTNRGPADKVTGHHIISTARGSHYQVILADGSTVSLNAASSLRFPIRFTGDTRFVELAGEAWFDVHHADRLPFSIRSGKVTTTVLGTAFDIRAYADQKSLKVAVQRGKVKVATEHRTLATLEKGEQLILSSDSVLFEQRIDTLLVGAWKQGNLNYEDEPLHYIVADLQRVFDDSISIQNAAIKDIRLTARYQQKDGIQKILTMICNLSETRLARKNGIYTIE